MNRYILDHGDYTVSLKKWLHYRLEEMAGIAFSDSCMVRQVLQVLGENRTVNCNHCTNCQQARR